MFQGSMNVVSLIIGVAAILAAGVVQALAGAEEPYLTAASPRQINECKDLGQKLDSSVRIWALADI